MTKTNANVDTVVGYAQKIFNLQAQRNNIDNEIESTRNAIAGLVTTQYAGKATPDANVKRAYKKAVPVKFNRTARLSEAMQANPVQAWTAEAAAQVMKGTKGSAAATLGKLVKGGKVSRVGEGRYQWTATAVAQ